MKLFLATASLLALLVLTACASSGVAPAQPVPMATEAIPAAPTFAETTLSTVTAAPVVTDTPASPLAEPTPNGATSLLPAPLYFLTGADGNSLQLWRMEPDGQTVGQLTNEPTGIADFDVSPADGALVYVAGSELVRTDATGGGRAALFTMPAIPNPTETGVGGMLAYPRWSPDGSQVAFGLQGVNLLDVASGAVTQLLVNDPVPDFATTRPEGPVRFYLPYSWSPDGDRLLVTVGYFPEGQEFALYDRAAGALTSLASPDGLTCCHPTWNGDGSALVLAGEGGFYAPGLGRVDAATGQVTPLTPIFQGQPGAPFFLVSHPTVAADGTVLAWRRVADGGTFDVAMSMPPLLQRVDPARASDPAAWQTVNPEPLRLVDARWASDASGAAVSVDEGRGWLETGNPLLWVPADGTPLVPLPASGRTPRWGPATP